MSRELVTTTEITDAQNYPILLGSRPTPARSGMAPCGLTYQHQAIWSDIPTIIESASQSPVLSIDFETRGGDYSSGVEVIGLGLAWDSGSVYLDWSTLYMSSRTPIIEMLRQHRGLIAHNVYFDGGVAIACLGFDVEWHACTYALYSMLSNEGWPGQSHGLKSAMVDILQWENSNEEELDRWLVLNGYYRRNKLKDNSPESLEVRMLAGTLKPDKGEMWRAPASILGKYCALDAEACYLLYTEHLKPLLDSFPDFSEFFHTCLMHHIHIHIHQKMVGLPMDREKLFLRREALLIEIENKLAEFRKHPDVRDHIAEIERGLLADLQAREPERYLKQKEPAREPPQYKKDGSLSKNWLRWKETSQKNSIPIVSKNWLNWQGKYKAALNGDPEYQFNVNSGQQLATLLYDHLGFEVRITTDSGLPATGIKALKHMGPVGTLLIEYNWLVKELSFIEDYIERTETRLTIHPGFRIPGTKTGRLSSKGPNLQQVPKTKRMMELFTARPGRVWVDLDFSALEPVVATEFSEDPNMAAIYGDGRPPNDIYLFVGAHIPGMRDKILATGYHPFNPTRETLARAKKECKHERSICKTVTLACQYGAGVNKVMQTLENDDIFLPRSDVEKIHSGYWSLFAKVKQLSYDLQRQWQFNGGWIPNGLVGRPMCIPEDSKHDALNRFIQSTGHDILIKYVYILCGELSRQGIDWSPVVMDFHDATTVEVPEADAELTVDIFKWAMDELNRQIGGTITLRGVPVIGRTLADVKEPEE